MSAEQNHTAFKDLLLTRRIEALPAGDSERLQAHLAACERCRELEGAVESGLAALTSQPVCAPPGLSRAARARARRRAEELAEHDARWQLAAVATGLAVVSGLASARVLWLGIDWLGRQSGLPLGVLVCLFAVLWLAPATLGGLALCWARARRAGLRRALEEVQS
jgi:predicted anti-sigma-YlaC factor YlaD